MNCSLKKSRRSFLVPLAGFIFLFCLLGMTSQAQKSKLYHEKSLEGIALSAVSVSTSGGSISVIHKSGEKSRVEVYVRGNNSGTLSEEEIEERMENYDLSIETSGDKLIATAKSRLKNSDWKKGLSISFTVYTPSKVNTDLSTSGGSVAVMDLQGDQKLRTSGGSLSIEGISGNVDGKTSGGSILLKNIKGKVNTMTSGGSISACYLSGNMNLATSGGSLLLEDLSGEIKAMTSGGSISGSNIAGALITKTSGGGISLRKMRCSLDAATSAGSINIEMEAMGDFLNITNSAGNVNLKLPPKLGLDLNIQANRISIPDLQNFSGNSNSKILKGAVHGGGVPVTIRSSSGTVSISM